jgi:serine/threonine protein kinase
VWAAHDPDLDRRVALKVLRPALAGSDDARARLQREGRAMARLRHPNVITVYEAIFSDGRGAIAMELIDGQSLAGWLAIKRTRDEIVAALLAAGRGLAAAHAAGMVHRDFKPHNVLVDRDGRIVVTDFGLARASATASKSIDPTDSVPGDDEAPSSVADAAAKALEAMHAAEAVAETAAASTDTVAAKTSARGTPVSATDRTAAATPVSATDRTAAATPVSGGSRRDHAASGALESPLTRTGELLGTPAYMPPEQLAGNEADARSDQFSFCVTAWEALTGHRPFTGKSLSDLIENVLTAAPSGGAAIPGRLRSILLRGLARDPNDRWRSMGSLLAALERAWHRPRRIKIAVGAGVLVAGVIAAGALLYVRSSSDASGAPCESPDVALREVWSPEIRASMAARVANRPHAQVPIDFFDRWRTRWVDLHRETCAKPAAPEFAIRRACLDALRDEMVLLMDQRDQLPPELIIGLDYSVILPEPEICANNPRALAPIDATDAKTRAAIKQLRYETLLARTQVTQITVDEYAKFIERARALKSPTLLAETLLGAASLAEHVADDPTEEAAACKLWDDAIGAAAEANHERYRVTAMTWRLNCATKLDESIERRLDLAKEIDQAADGLGDRSVRSQADEIIAHVELASGRWTAAIERLVRARLRWKALGSILQELEMMVEEAGARRTRHHGDDLDVAADLLRTVTGFGPVGERRARSELADLLWALGDFERAAKLQAPAVLRGDEDVDVVVTVVGNASAADVVAVVDPNLDPTRISMLEYDGEIAAGRTDAAGTLRLRAPKGGVIVARAGSSLAAALVPDRGGPVTLTLQPTVALSGTVSGFDGVAADDPSPTARAARRQMPAIYATTAIGHARLTWHAPIAVDGTWSLPAVLPGRYVVAADVTSALDDDHAAQVQIMAGAAPVAPIVLAYPKPSAIRFVVRPAVGGRLVLLPPGPHPRTWKEVDARLAAAAALSMTDVGHPLHPSDRIPGTQIGDGIADVAVLGATPVVACVLPGAISPFRRSLWWIVPGPDKAQPICRDVTATDAPVVIETR